jgi:large subunit ribosomal protein L13
MIIDGKHAVFGRLSSTTAKELLKGNDVIVLNAEKIIITGNPKDTKEKYLQQIRRGSPQHGPFFPKMPNLILHRAVRGMMPRKKAKGRDALKKLKIYNDFPSEFEKKEVITLAKEIRTDFITLGELSKTLGWKKR